MFIAIDIFGKSSQNPRESDFDIIEEKHVKSSSINAVTTQFTVNFRKIWHWKMKDV